MRSNPMGLGAQDPHTAWVAGSELWVLPIARLQFLVQLLQDEAGGLSPAQPRPICSLSCCERQALGQSSGLSHTVLGSLPSMCPPLPDRALASSGMLSQPSVATLIHLPLLAHHMAFG